MEPPKHSPYFLVSGVEPYSPFDISMAVDTGEKESRFDYVNLLKGARELALRNLEWAKGKQKVDFDGRTEPLDGSLVAIQHPSIKKDEGRS